MHCNREDLLFLLSPNVCETKRTELGNAANVLEKVSHAKLPTTVPADPKNILVDVAVLLIHAQKYNPYEEKLQRDLSFP